MLEDALVILIYIALIVLIIALIALCIKFIGTLNKADKLIENITRKAETLDSVFEMIEYTTSSFGRLGETIVQKLTGFTKKIFNRKKKKERNDYYE